MNIELILMVLFSIFMVYMFVMIIIHGGEILGWKFRVVKKYIRHSGKVKWKIQQKFWGVWFFHNCGGEYWDGYYDNEKECVEQYNKLITRKKSVIIKP